MDSIVITGSQKMQSWMVDILFSEPGQAKTDDTAAAASAAAAAAVTVASSARSTVAPATGQAIAALQAGGTAATSATASATSDTDVMDPKYMTVAQANATVASNNAMTSAQISAALYSGGGLQDVGLVGQTDTFADAIEVERNSAQLALNLANDPAAAAAAGQDPNSLKEEAAYTNAHADSLQNAFNNHTLVIQKLSDVPGLNYTGYETFGGPSPNSQPESGSWTESYDKEAMNEFKSQFTGGKQWGVSEIGSVMVLMTWTDDSLNSWT